MAAAAAPIAASVIGGLLQSKGAKKAAEAANKGPQVPRVYEQAASQGAWNSIQGMLGHMPGYGGRMSQDPNYLQNASINQAQTLLGAGDQGFQNALRTVNTAAQQGFNPQDLQLAQQYTQPFWDYQRTQGLGQVRETEAQRGSYFGSGGMRSENEFLQGLSANQSQQLLPLAMQMSQYRLGAAQSIPALLMGQLGFNTGMWGLGEQQRGLQQADLDRRYQEWVRNSPMAWQSSLAGLMGGTPFFNPPMMPNAYMGMGSALSNLGSSPGFMQMMQNYFPPSGTGTGTTK